MSLVQDFAAASTVRTPRTRDFIDTLKIGTCITSAWFALGTSAYLSLAPWGWQGRLGVTAMTAALAVGAYKHYWTKKAKDKVTGLRFPTLVEGAPSDLIRMTRDISAYLGFKKPVPVRLLNAGKDCINAFSGRDCIYMTREMRKRLTTEERKFPVAHELAHTRYYYAGKFHLTETARVIAPALFPGVLLSVFSQVAANSFPSMGTIAGAYLTSQALMHFTRAAIFQAARFDEYRADRIGAEATGNPIAAISFLSKLGNNRDRSLSEALSSTHPKRNHRILNIIDSFNEMHPEQAITVGGYDMKGKKTVIRAPEKAQFLVIDARKFDGRQYRLTPVNLAII